MTVKVRPASAADAEALASLSRIVLAWHAEHYPADFRADADSQELADFFSRQVADENARLAIAELDAVPVGYIYFRYRPQTGSAFTPPRPLQLYIEHVVVVADHRRQGVGTALMAYAESLGERDGEIALDTMGLNSSAQAFFARHGFEVAKLVMRKRTMAGG